MKNKMIGIAAVLLIALMVVGVTYAMWTETLYINGKVNMGELDAQFTDWFWNCTWDTGLPVPIEKQTFEVDIYPDNGDFQYIYVDIYDLYPCIVIHVYLNITNTGTIPWIVQSVTVTNSTGFPGTVTFSPPLIGTQVEPDEYISANLEVHLNNDAEEDTWYWFFVAIKVVQWNEYVPPSI